MRVGIIIAVIWLIVAVYMYKTYGFVIDKVKEQNKDSNPGMYDLAGIFVFIFWPFFMPSIIIKMIKKTKEKRKEQDKE